MNTNSKKPATTIQFQWVDKPFRSDAEYEVSPEDGSWGFTVTASVKVDVESDPPSYIWRVTDSSYAVFRTGRATSRQLGKKGAEEGALEALQAGRDRCDKFVADYQKLGSMIRKTLDHLTQQEPARLPADWLR